MKKISAEISAEIEATVAALPNTPSEGVIAKAREYLDTLDVMFYRMDTVFDPLQERNRRMIRATCTACGEECYYEPCDVTEGCSRGGYSIGKGYVDHEGREVSCYSRVQCPYCEKEVEAVHTSKFKSEYQIGCTHVGEILNVRGHLVVLSWFFAKTMNKQAVTAVKQYQCEGILLVKGEPARVSGFGKQYYDTYFRGRWQKYSSYTNSFGDWKRDEFVYDPEVIYTTDAATCGIDRYLSEGKGSKRPGAYLWMWSKCPAVENIVTSGYGDYVDTVICACTKTGGYYYEKTQFTISEVSNYIDFSKVKPHELMRCEKHNRGLWREIGLEKFAFRGWLYDVYGEYISVERLDQCYAERVADWRTVLRKRGKWRPSMQRTFNYVDREKRKWLLTEYKRKRIAKKRYDEQLAIDMKRVERYGNTCIIGPGFLNDYWNMLEKVYDGQLPEELIYPRDLVEAHDRVQKLVKEKECEALRKKFSKRFEELSRYALIDEKLGLMIRPCETQMEMIREGKFLHHCVATYANSHAEGRTSIFFIRRIDAPGAPYYTLEYKNGAVAQNRGASNCDRTGNVIKFEKIWLDHVNKINSKESKKE